MLSNKSVRGGKEQVDRKVANMVGTFLYKDSDGFQLTTIKTESEKVPDTVGTFLYEDSDGFQLIAIKTEPEKVTNMVGTFLNDDVLSN